MVNLKYTNQDYTAILEELINAVKNGETGLTSAWNNMSQADPMFLLLHLFAAHKDMENFMIDYRLNESFMSTARERASMVRIARSYGYKIPSYKTGSALYEITSIPGVTENEFIIPNWSTFIDTLSNRSFVYISDDGNDYVGDLAGGIPALSPLRLFEGVKQTHSFLTSTIDRETRTHIISNQSISIGASNSPLKMVSKLVNGSQVFTEVPNLLEYVGTDLYVYELDVDPQGITYIRFHQNLDLNAAELLGSFTLTYLVSSGSAANFSQSIKTTEAYEVTLEGNVSLDVIASLDVDSVTPGVDPATESEIKSGFANYIANAETLISLYKIYNYLMNIQTINPDIAKVAVFNNREDAIKGELSGSDVPTNMYPFEVCIVLMDSSNVVINDSDVLADVQNKVALPTEVLLNGKAGVVQFAGPINVTTGKEHVQVFLKFYNTVSLDSPTLQSRIRTAVKDYLDSLNVGRPATSEEMRSFLRSSGFSEDIYGNSALEEVLFREDGTAGTGVNIYYPRINRVVNIDTANLLSDIFMSNDGSSW